MSYPRFFVSAGDIGETVTLTGSDAHHACDVLRLKKGDLIAVSDMQRNEYICRITELGNTLVAAVGECRHSLSEDSYETVLFQALVKGDKFENVVQKSTELGVTRIVPVLTERCVVRPDAKAMASKIERYRKIALAAAKQSGRGIVPEITDCVKYCEALAMMKEKGFPFVCYEGDGTVYISELLHSVRNTERVSFLIGPEGGLSAGETALAVGNGIALAGLGERILRTETAPLFVLSAINVLFHQNL